MIAHYLSTSGGKDSTAAGLHLLELGVEFRAVFFDTGWEAPQTYAYIEEVLSPLFGGVTTLRHMPPGEPDPIALDLEARHLAGRASAMVRWCLHKAMFPAPVNRRWCTDHLKVACAREVSRTALAVGEVPVQVVGVRGEESATRAALPERELNTQVDCMVWRPLLRWAMADVVDIHRRHGVTPNPLYLTHGVNRVGCWPCIGCRKQELRAVAEFDPARIALIRDLEDAVAERAEQRAAERDEARLTRPAFFQAARRNSEGKRPYTPIDAMVAWARTRRGSDVVDDAPLDTSGGCSIWGFCESNAEDDA